MNLPCLLDDKMKPRADLHPIRLTVDRTLQPLSMAEMVLPPEDAPVCVRDFVRLCDSFGDDEIYRVSSISEEPDTIMDVVEPYLLQLGFLDRTPRGRVPTRAAYAHLQVPYPERSEQGGLFA